jgi:hypothetical protein
MNPVTDLKTNPNAAIGSGSVTGGAATATALPKPTTTTGVVFGASPGMPGIFKSNFDYQLVRGMLAGAYGEGGAFGELYQRGGLASHVGCQLCRSGGRGRSSNQREREPAVRRLFPARPNRHRAGHGRTGACRAASLYGFRKGPSRRGAEFRGLLRVCARQSDRRALVV